MSLKNKGTVAFLGLVAYAAALSAFVLYQKHVLLQEMDQIRAGFEEEALIGEAELATLRTLRSLQVPIRSPQEISAERIRERLAVMRSVYRELPNSRTLAGPSLGGLQAALERVSAAPTLANYAALRETLAAAERLLGRRLDEIKRRQRQRVAGFRLRSDVVAGVALAIGLLGIAGIGLISRRYVARISQGLDYVHARTLQLVDRAPGAGVAHPDELQRLADTVDQVAGVLKERRQEEELNRQKHIHQERVAAIGTLAAGIIHEVGNPIAAISALVEQMKSERGGAAATRDEAREPRFDQILEHLQRINATFRDISDFAALQSAEPELLDLNQLVDMTFRLLRHEQPLASIDCRLDLDPNLPAIRGIGDHLTQVITSLLLNAADAVSELAGRQPVVSVTTRLAGSEACLVVHDNGSGMDETTRRRAFEAFFTTKAPGAGTGLGLTLCESIVASHGGRIEVESAPEVGTAVHVHLAIAGREPPALAGA